MSPIPKTQKAQVMYAVNEPIKFEDIPVQTPKSGEILVHLLYTGVCHSDLSGWRNHYDKITLPFPLVGGHEGSGVVVAKGDGVTNFEIGDKVGVKYVNSTCLNCSFCLQGAESNCPNATFCGFSQNGTFQQYCIATASHAAHIPDGVDLAMVAPILCAGITVYKALKQSDAKSGDSVVITGAGGGLGSLAIQYAHAMGFNVIGVDTGDDKKEYVLSHGGDHFVDYLKDDLAAKILSLTNGEGPQAVIHVAVSERAINASLDYIRPTGTVVLISLPPSAVLQSPIFEHVQKCITIRGSLVGNRQDTAEALDFVRRGLVTTPYKLAGLSELPRIYELMESNKIVGRYVLDTSK